VNAMCRERLTPGPAQGAPRPGRDAGRGPSGCPVQLYDAADVTGEILAHSESLPLNPVAAEREFVESHSFRYRADVGRYLFVQIDKNLRSFGVIYRQPPNGSSFASPLSRRN